MGAFHTLCNFLGIIGKRFLDAGLRDLAVESEVITEGSIDRALNGQQYKLVYEALQRLAWKGFLGWFQRNQATPEEESQSLLDETRLLVVSLNQSATQENLDAILRSPCFVYLFDLFQKFLAFLRCDAGPLAQF